MSRYQKQVGTGSRNSKRKRPNYFRSRAWPGDTGTRTAFNMLSRYAPESRYDLVSKQRQMRAEISAAVGEAEEDAKISLNLVHAPVFYGTTFGICCDLERDIDAMALAGALRDAGFVVAAPSESSRATSALLGRPASICAIHSQR